jgi:hypothetical protein
MNIFSQDCHFLVQGMKEESPGYELVLEILVKATGKSQYTSG